MKIFRFLTTKKPGRNQEESSSTSARPIYPSEKKLDLVLEQSIKEIGPVLRKLSNE